MASAQALETPWGWTSNLHQRIEVVKATNSGTVTFTIAPEDQNKVARNHWPVVFIDYQNDGQQITQMYNIYEDTQFTVQLNNPDAKVTIYGEDGLWKLVANNQSLKDAHLERATALRYVDLNDNVLGTANADAKYAFAPSVAPTATEEGKGNVKLQSLFLNNNRLKKVEFIAEQYPSLEEFSASENLIATMNLSSFQKLSRVDLSKNLLTQFLLPENMPAENRDIYVGGNYAAFNVTPASPGIYRARTAADNWLDLSVNKLNIATLPKQAANLPTENFIYTLQERYKLPLSKRSNDEFELLEEIDISDQLKAFGVLAAQATTSYDWYIEENATTDQYRKLTKGVDYTESNGKFKFMRGLGKTARIFAAMTTQAFPHPLESYERLAAPAEADYTTGFDAVTNQPAGGTQSPDKRSYKDANGRPKTDNNLGDGTTRALNTRFFRTNTITLDATKQNYWYGFNDHNWNDKENWTGRFVPPTTPADYTGDEKSTVHFASIENYGSAAIRDLHVDNDRKIYDYINLSQKGRGLVVPAGTKLQIVNAIKLGNNVGWHNDLHNDSDNSTDQVNRRLLVKSTPGQSNGTLLIGDMTGSPTSTFTTYKNSSYASAVSAQQTPVLNLAGDVKEVPLRVEFYSAAFDGNRNKQDATWQYFGIPLRRMAANYRPSVAWIRKYNRLKNDDIDEKWDEIPATEEFEATKAYEISQPQPITHRFVGSLYTDDLNITGLSNSVSGTTPYGDWNIHSNPYTAAMDISQVTLGGPLDQTIYLYNLGTRKQWLANNQPASPAGGDAVNGPGFYTAIPVALAGRVAGLPLEIPSMSAFALRATGAGGTVSYAYRNLQKNQEQNRTQGKRRPVPAIIVDLNSELSADRIVLAETSEATPGYDQGYDGEKVFSAGTAQLYAAADRKYEVSSTNEIDDTELGVIAADDAKDYTLSFQLSEELPNQIYYLVDRKLGTTRTVQNGDVYRFTASADDAPKRFLLTKKAPAIDTDAVAKGIDLRVLADRQLVVNNHTEEEATVEVFDLKGKRLMTFKVAAASQHSETIDGQGVYVIKATNAKVTVLERYRVF